MLVKPSERYKKSYLGAFKESGITEGDLNIMMPGKGETFKAFVRRLLDNSQGLRIKRGWVPSTTFWLVNEDKFIGRLSIRHSLNKKVRREAGHIGYFIRPSERKRGYGKLILTLGLKEARKLGLTKTLITCDVGNIASKKIIEFHGGKFKNKVSGKKGTLDKLRYWIDIR